MNSLDPQIAWSIPAPDQLNDRAREALSEALGLSFHGVNLPFAHTVAHRFVDDDHDVLLRIVRNSTSEHAVELVAFGAEVSAEQAVDLEVAVHDALAALGSPTFEPRRLVVPVGLSVSSRLVSLAESLSTTATALLGAHLLPVEVLGDRLATTVGPMDLVLPLEAEQLLGPDIRRRAIFDGTVVRIWLSGTWSVAEPSNLLVYAVDPEDNLVPAETDVQSGLGRLRLELPWPHQAPPTEILVVVMPRE